MRYIAIERRGPYLWVTFDRPGKLNVLHAEDLPGLRDTIVNLDPGVTGLVFTGAGPAAFSAGMNIETFVGMDQAAAKAFIGQLAGVMHSIANVITAPGLLAEATERLLERTATHTRTVTASQRRLFSLWLNHPLDAAVEHSTDEFGGTFGAQETRDQIAHHHRRITGRSLARWSWSGTEIRLKRAAPGPSTTPTIKEWRFVRD